MRDVEYLLGTRDRYIRKAAFFFEFLEIVLRTRMRKYTIFEANEKDDRKLEALCHMDGHDGNSGRTIIFVRIRRQSGVVDEFPKPVSFLLIVINGGVDQFFQILETRGSFVRSFRSKASGVTRIFDGRYNNIRYRMRRIF